MSSATADPRPQPPRSPNRRRGLLLGLGALVLAAIVAVVLVLVLGGGNSAPTEVRPKGLVFHSAPAVGPPAVTVDKDTGAAAPGDLFLAPKRLAPQAGPMIVDNKGRLVWFLRVPKGEAANDLQIQRYQGKPVLTWWTGFTDGTGHGHGTYYIADTHYRIIKKLHAGNGLEGDLHEFRLTPRGTALITIYHDTTGDLTAVGGSDHGRVIDSVVQEVDVKTGKVLFQWNSLDHVPVGDSYITPDTKFANSDAGYFDYFHVNSVAEANDGNLLISGRNVDAVYKVDRKTGRVLWELGGKHSDFKMGPGTRTAFQHDAQEHPDGTMTIFDNGSSPQVHPESRALLLRLDETARTATLIKAFTHDPPISAAAEGNVQKLPGGHYFVNWGFGGTMSEFAPDGTLVYDAKLPPEVESYRGFRFAGWHGRPLTKPSVAVRRQGGGLRVWASWNGATDVARWQVLAGSSRTKLRPAGTASRTGFETTISARGRGPFVEVRALDAQGGTLGTSPVVRARG